MSPVPNLENVKYVCGETECLCLFSTRLKWMRHALTNKRHPCARSGVILLSEFLPKLEEPGKQITSCTDIFGNILTVSGTQA
jgi:hypothetical protein